MDDRAEPKTASSFRDLLEQLLLAGVGAASLTRERAEEILDDLVRRGKLTRDEARDLADELAESSRAGAGSLAERASHSLAGLFRELGLVTRLENDELELRVAQLEHRVRLLEQTQGAAETVDEPRPQPKPAQP